MKHTRCTQVFLAPSLFVFFLSLLWWILSCSLLCLVSSVRTPFLYPLSLTSCSWKQQRKQPIASVKSFTDDAVLLHIFWDVQKAEYNTYRYNHACHCRQQESKPASHCLMVTFLWALPISTPLSLILALVTQPERITTLRSLNTSSFLRGDTAKHPLTELWGQLSSSTFSTQEAWVRASVGKYLQVLFSKWIVATKWKQQRKT